MRSFSAIFCGARSGYVWVLWGVHYGIHYGTHRHAPSTPPLRMLASCAWPPAARLHACLPASWHACLPARRGRQTGRGCQRGSGVCAAATWVACGPAGRVRRAAVASLFGRSASCRSSAARCRSRSASSNAALCSAGCGCARPRISTSVPRCRAVSLRAGCIGGDGGGGGGGIEFMTMQMLRRHLAFAHRQPKQP